MNAHKRAEKLRISTIGAAEKEAYTKEISEPGKPALISWAHHLGVQGFQEVRVSVRESVGQFGYPFVKQTNKTVG